MARRVASHLALSISVLKSPREMVNLLLISSIERSNTFNSDRFSALRLLRSISILQAMASALIQIQVLLVRRCSYFVIKILWGTTYSCFSVCISSLIFCSSISTSLRMVLAMVFNAVPSFLALTLNSVLSSDNAARNRYAA